jgi:hypothetical protein
VSKIAPINRGLQVLENGSNFLSAMFLRWLQTVESRLNKAVVTDDNGNIAYGGATIPSDSHPDRLTYFYPNNACRIVDINGAIIDCYNAYIRDDNGTPNWQYIGSGAATIQYITQPSQISNKFVAIDNGGQLPSGSSIPWVKVFEIDASGNVNIKTGSTYTATL